MKAGRGDVSAMLIIAFLFQLVTPIVVLADDNTADTSFEASLRHSICKVDISEDGDSSQTTGHTDGFVCDWCTLCSVGAPPVLDRLPDVHVLISSLAEGSVAYGTPESLSLSLADREKTPAPRGPPSASGLKSHSDDAFLI